MGGGRHSTGRLRSHRFERCAVERLAFFVGIFLWFAVGVKWKDKAIMVVHVGAFISLLAGYLSS